MTEETHIDVGAEEGSQKYKIDRGVFVCSERADHFIGNLTKLADYLEGLPKGYSKFSMWRYCAIPFPEVAFYPPGPGYLDIGAGDRCTTACAIGHGPAAGINLDTSQYAPNWATYSQLVFGLECGFPEWEWCFSWGWGLVDNTPQGAAFRIKALLDGFSIPEGFSIMKVPRDYKEQFKEKGGFSYEY